jgi:hypothetical protein
LPSIVSPNRAHDIDGVAVSRVGVGDEWEFDRVGDTAGLVEHLGEAHEPQIGHPEA